MAQKILFVEDNPDLMSLVKDALAGRGYEFVWAPNAADGLAMAAQHAPDLILLDVNLSAGDGYELARRLRFQDPQPPAYAPILAVTGNALRGDAEKALAAGCDVYMAKPIDIRELLARVEGFLAATAR